MTTRRTLAGLMIVMGSVAVVACSDATSPNPLAEHYQLKTVRGITLPATGVSSDLSSHLIQDGGLTFGERDSVIFSMSDSIIFTDHPAVIDALDQKRDFSVKTRYSRRGGRVVLHWTEFNTDTGFVKGDTLVLRWHDPNSFGPPTELLYTAAVIP